jgi:hypothetical protein
MRGNRKAMVIGSTFRIGTLKVKVAALDGEIVVYRFGSF